MLGSRNSFPDTLKSELAVVAAVLFAHNGVFANEFLDSLEFRHGIAFYHDLKYPADFQHFDYVNPDAPKGGRLVLPTQTNFNSLASTGDFGTPPQLLAGHVLVEGSPRRWRVSVLSCPRLNPIGATGCFAVVASDRLASA